MAAEASDGMDGYSGENHRLEALFRPASDRTGRRIVGLLFVVTGVTAAATAAVIPVLIAGEANQALAQEEGAALAGLVALTVLWLWFAVHRCLLRPMERLAADVHLLAAANTTAVHVVDEDYPDLEPLPEAINALTDRLAATRRDVGHAVADSAERLAEQHNRLTAILRDLDEGVLVCNLRHQVLVHNRAALTLLKIGAEPVGEAGQPRNLFTMMLAEPVRHALEQLIRHDGDGDAGRLVAGTPDGRTLLDGRMSLVWHEGATVSGGPVVGGPVVGGRTVTGYVLTFADATRQLAALGQRDALLRATTEELRAPLANLRAVTDTLNACPDLETAARANFEAALAHECDSLIGLLEKISEQYRTTITGNWPMSDLRSHTLIDLVRHRVRAHRQVTVTSAGIPCRLYGDSYSLVLLLDHLIERVGAATGATDFELSTDAAARWIFFDLRWDGEPVPSARIDTWKTEPLPAALGGLTIGDVLRHHRSDLWSDLNTATGKARLRLPLPPAPEPAEPACRPTLLPEVIDFSPLRQVLDGNEAHDRRLDDLNFVVFDIETSGLHPADGDEIIAIAAVRVTGHRIVTAETFQTLVNPGHPIPYEATLCHGITDEQVRAHPEITTALPQFKAFAGADVLVAHTAAFDLGFLRARERSCGIRFDNAILDTSLLSLWLHGQNADHSLDGIARRLGIAAIDRDTPLGDSLLTAAVLLAFLEQMCDRGLVTLGDALRETNVLIDHQPRELKP